MTSKIMYNNQITLKIQKLLTQLYSQDQQKSSKLQEDKTFINEMQRQFELLLNCSDIFQTLDVFKNTREYVKDIMENNTIQFLPLLKNKNEFKTPKFEQNLLKFSNKLYKFQKIFPVSFQFNLL
ncbi:unnamed protein product [Paramecium octaurelia]|uniref:Uncharacterized protein n=1 Tax=Paramecium octaurelia TaxID=43137 RepID=A0A8S1UT19_PAROT|nr:unnamed protein product [Paramecium octaurelia]